MKKQEFIEKLRARLSGLPKQDVEEHIAFYGEMIDDRMEEGVSEEDAVRDIGSVDKIATQIIADIPLAKIAKEKIKPKRRLQAWEIVLLALGSPIWLSLAVAAFSVVLSLYAVLWSLIVSVWAGFGALVGAAFGGAVGGIVLACVGMGYTGIALLAAGIVCAGLSIFLFFGCKAATIGVARLTKNIAVCIKKCFVRKEKVS